MRYRRSIGVHDLINIEAQAAKEIISDVLSYNEKNTYQKMKMKIPYNARHMDNIFLVLAAGSSRESCISSATSFRERNKSYLPVEQTR